MDTIVVRLASLELHNMKNVGCGKLTMPNVLRREPHVSGSEVLGIYGQNGSGKTAAIDALFYLQNIMVGQSLSDSMSDYIGAGSEHMSIIAEFYIFAGNVMYEAGYKVFVRRKEKGVQIERETLSLAKNFEGKRTNKTVFMDYARDDEKSIFKPQVRFQELIAEHAENETDLIVARKMAEKSNCSYIFGESSWEIFSREHHSQFREYAFIIQALFHYALKDLFVIRSSHSGFISANFFLPMAFRIEQDEIGLKGDLPIPLAGPVVIYEKEKAILETIVEQINSVLFTIIPGMKIGIRYYGTQLLDDGQEGHKIELTSERENIPALPIRMESEGIIKLISILNALILAFGNESVCLAIDELDAGIFEYMLGELLSVFQESAKGQLIFTSHNLRALEMLDKDCIVLSTANPENRYIRMRNVKPTNNLRDMYLRGITLGGQEELIYEETDSLKMARAFRKAGRKAKNGE